MPTHIVVPDERAEQLRRFSQSLNISMADAIGVLINDAVAAGKIPADVPGFKVFRHGQEVTFEADGAFVKHMNRDAAKDYADRLRAVARSIITPSADNPFMPTPDILRRGTGVKLREPATGAEKTVAPSIADDLAALIGNAAA